MRYKINSKRIYYFLLSGLLLLTACENKGLSFSASEVRQITENWKMQSSEKIIAENEASISRTEFSADEWLDAVVPGTVLGGIATHGVIEDPYFGKNMQNISKQKFKSPWWYRTVFNLDADDLEKNISLRFNGINYRADLWLNGQKVAGKNEFAGTYRMFTFNVNDYVKEGQNSLALKIWQHADGEYSIGFVDWNPLPRDRNMGIFRDVFLEINEGVKVRSPFVWSKVNTETLKDADLFVQAEV